MATVNAVILVAFSVHQVTEVSRGQLVTASKTLGLGRHAEGGKSAQERSHWPTTESNRQIPANGQSRTEFRKAKVL